MGDLLGERLLTLTLEIREAKHEVTKARAALAAADRTQGNAKQIYAEAARHLEQCRVALLNYAEDLR